MLTEKITETREELFIHLYETAFPGIAGFIHKMGGSLEEAKDIFQDALVIHYERSLKDQWSPDTNDSQYLLGICRHLWYKKFRENMRSRSLDSGIVIQNAEEDPKISEQLLKFVASSGKKCMDLLSSFYYDKLSMRELAKKFSFSGERSATAQKYKCLEKIRSTIKNKSLNKEDFYE